MMIRPMESADIPRAAEIHVFGWRSAYRGIVSDEFLFKDFTVAKRMEKFAEYLAKGEETYVFDDGILKAFLTVGFSRDEDKPDSFNLSGLYVDPLMQGQGIGSILVDHFEKIAVERGFNDVYLWAFEENKSARTFYEKHGYTPDGVTKILQPHGWKGIRYSKDFGGLT